MATMQTTTTRPAETAAAAAAGQPTTQATPPATQPAATQPPATQQTPDLSRLDKIDPILKEMIEKGDTSVLSGLSNDQMMSLLFKSLKNNVENERYRVEYERKTQQELDDVKKKLAQQRDAFMAAYNDPEGKPRADLTPEQKNNRETLMNYWDQKIKSVTDPVAGQQEVLVNEHHFKHSEFYKAKAEAAENEIRKLKENLQKNNVKDLMSSLTSPIPASTTSSRFVDVPIPTPVHQQQQQKPAESVPVDPNQKYQKLMEALKSEMRNPMGTGGPMMFERDNRFSPYGQKK